MKMKDEPKKRVVLQYVDAFNRGDLETMHQLFTHDALIFGVLGWGTLEQAIPIWRELHEAFSIRLQVEGIITEGDIVAVRYTERGTSVGQFRGQPATGQSYEIVAMEWFLIQEEKIQRRWGARDSATQFRQMGLSI
jgi:steroid delta-isomerase-like uncharacterized protein